MALDAAVIAVGLGARRGAAADALCAAVAAALPAGVRADTLATAAFKHDDPVFAEAAVRLDLPIVYVTAEALTGACPPDRRNDSVTRLVGVPSVAEAAALAAAGPGARLIVAKRIVGGVACAVAEGTA